MARNLLPILFDPRLPSHRTQAAWRSPWLTPFAHALTYAQEKGEARLLRPDGSLVRFWRVGDGVMQRTYTTITYA